jgi:hypothetical protein
MIRRGVELTARPQPHACIRARAGSTRTCANDEACMIRRGTQLTAGSHIHASEVELEPLGGDEQKLYSIVISFFLGLAYLACFASAVLLSPRG